jgi:hypothetical protein
MTDTMSQVREALQELYTCGCSVIDALDDSDLIDADSVQRFEDALHEAKAALSRPAPDVPGADELEAIRARHEADILCNNMHPHHKQAEADRATLLRLLDAARAELVGVREAAQKYEEDTRIFFNRPASGDRLAAALKGSGHD